MRTGDSAVPVETPPRERWRPSVGAWPEGRGARFRVWAPDAKAVEVVLDPDGPSPRAVAMDRGDDGSFSAVVDGVKPGARYKFRPDGRGPFPDPATRSQPDGVHGASALVDPDAFAWTDQTWRGLAPAEVVVYELHVGTFSPEGTFRGVTGRLPFLRDLGVTAIELMPLADFAGSRSWGYDGVDLFAPSHSYGTPDDLRALVDAAHGLGLGVFFDVVYNHFGPVGNYALEFTKKYLSTTHSSAWAACVNLDGEGGRGVRDFFVENARVWVHEYHADGLRLDATHALIDDSPQNLVAEIVERVQATVSGRRVLIVAEDHRNDARMLRTPEDGGWGLDGVWADDLHHELRRQIAGDHEAYYRDYTGTVADVATTINQGWFYTGQHSVHNDVDRGTDPAGLAPRAFYVCIENHDQVGNRAMGDRLPVKIGLDAYRAVSTLLLCLPQTPLLFMGQEWAAGTPFQYFTDHDPELGKIVTEGRRKEFRHFKAFEDPEARDQIPDPQDPNTFARSKLDWSEVGREPHASVLRLYQSVLAFRSHEPALRADEPGSFRADAADEATLLLRREAEGAPAVWLAVRFQGEGTLDLAPHAGADAGAWELVMTSEDAGFAAEPRAPEIALSGPAPVINFRGPSAVILRQRPVGTAVLKG